MEKTSLGSRELNELLAKELNRKKDVTKKVKSLGSAERKTMKQLKALAKPVLGTTAVETVLSPTKTTSTSGQHKQGLFEKFTAERTPEKPAPKPVDKPAERVVSAEKPTTKERVDSPAENSQSELSAEEALVQESMIQAMLQQHSAMQQLGQSQSSLAAAAALATASTGRGLDTFSPYLGMHPMWSMYSPTFAGSGVSGLPMMDPGTAATFGYLPGMAGYAQSNKTPSPTKSTTTSGKKQSSGSAATSQAKKTSAMQETVKKSQVQGKKSSDASMGVKKTPTSLASSSSQQGVKRPRSPAKTSTPLVVPKFSSGNYPPAKRSAPVPKPQGETKGVVKVTYGGPHVTGKQQQSAVRGLAQRGRVGLPSGQPYRKPVASATQSMTSKLTAVPRHGTTVSKPAVGVGTSQPRKVPVYPVDVDLVSPPRRVPPPAHGGTGGRGQKTGANARWRRDVGTGFQQTCHETPSSSQSTVFQ